MQRIKLFGRRRLFSDYEENKVRTVICRDCGCRLETAESTQAILCPNCGGRRFDLAIFQDTTHDGKPRKSLFKDYDTPYEKDLKDYSGKKMSKDDFEKVFSEKGKDLIEKNFAEIDGDTVILSEDAYGAEKLFSKMIISVTKTLILEPEIVNGSIDKEVVLRGLESRGIPMQGIACLRKAHNLPEPERVRIFSDECECPEQWIEDSHIIEDIEAEYNNQSFPIEQFVKILHERYPDAPEGILDMLIEKGVLFMDGTTVSVHRN